MNPIKIATVAITIWAATAASASAQTGSRSLDTLSQTAQMTSGRQDFRSAPTCPPVCDVNVPARPSSSAGYDTYMEQYRRYRADYERYRGQIERQNANSGWVRFLSGANQAISLYERGIEAKTLTQASGKAAADPTGNMLSSFADLVSVLH